jgi:hypothetical protein
MTVVRQKNITAQIFDNVLFLAEVFGDGADQDIPKVPVLEMARCFELAPLPSVITSDRDGMSVALEAHQR